MTYIQPLVLIFLTMAFIGLVRLRHCKGSCLASSGVLGLLLLSWPPVDWLVSRPLEGRYPIRPFPPVLAQAIVVLSSAVSPPLYERPYPLPDRETFERCEYAAWLHTHWQPLPVLACGGRGTTRAAQPVAVTMRQLLQQAGVPDAMIWTEQRSRSTHENAVFCAEILRQRGIKRIALVVEAQSMLRAEACFRKQGIEVVPAPCEFREFSSHLEEFLPNWRTIGRNEGTLHETVGLAWYWLRGWV
jgi:uncharacterized SAM-binding protein YcdF (DUF218 family)